MAESQELTIIDRGSTGISPEELLSDELLGYLSSASGSGGFNPALGTSSDARYPDYKEFLSSINQSVVLQIRPEELSAGKYDDLDLTGGADDEKRYIIEDKAIYGTNNYDEMVELITKMYGYTMLSEGLNFDKNYAPIPFDTSLWSSLPLSAFKEIQ
jgi:hypothetical protein